MNVQVRHEKPDFTANAISIALMAKGTDHDLLVKLIVAELGAAYAKGGLAALAMVTEGINQL